MRRAIIACVAIAFLTSPLHAESALGNAALKGATKGAAGGAGGAGGGGAQGGQGDAVLQHQQLLQEISQARRNPQPSTGPGVGGTAQTKGRR
jgi:hypothetical protein